MLVDDPLRSTIGTLQKLTTEEINKKCLQHHSSFQLYDYYNYHMMTGGKKNIKYTS